MEKLEDVKVKW